MSSTARTVRLRNLQRKFVESDQKYPELRHVAVCLADASGNIYKTWQHPSGCAVWGVAGGDWCKLLGVSSKTGLQRHPLHTHFLEFDRLGESFRHSDCTYYCEVGETEADASKCWMLDKISAGSHPIAAADMPATRTGNLYRAIEHFSELADEATEIFSAQIPDEWHVDDASVFRWLELLYHTLQPDEHEHGIYSLMFLPGGVFDASVMTIAVLTGRVSDSALPDTPEHVAQSARGSVLLFGRQDKPIVNSKSKDTLTNAQYDVVVALLNFGDEGLTKDKLDRESGRGDARKILKRLAENDPDWKSVISFPGTTGKGYRIL